MANPSNASTLDCILGTVKVNIQDALLKQGLEHTTENILSLLCNRDWLENALSLSVPSSAVTGRNHETLPELLSFQVRTNPHHCLVKFTQHGDLSSVVTLNFQQFEKRVNAAAKELAHRFPGRSNICIALISVKTVEALVFTMAAWKLGWTVASLFPKTPTELLAYQLKVVEADYICVRQVDQKLAKQLSFELKKTIILQDVSSPIRNTEADSDEGVYLDCSITSEDGFELPKGPTPDTPACWLMSTSSKDGESVKAIRLTHRQIMGNCRSFAQLWTGLEFDQSDAHLAWLPFHHVMGLVVNFCFKGLFLGVPLCLRAQPNLPPTPDEILRELLIYKPTSMFSVPWMLEVWAERMELDSKGFEPYLDLIQKMKYIASGGAPLGHKVGTFLRRNGVAVMEAMGATEVAGAIMSEVPPFLFDKPLDGWMTILPGFSVELKPLEDSVSINSGELMVFSKTLTSHIRKSPGIGKSIETVDSFEVFGTGDIFEGRVADGRQQYRFVSRKDDLVLLNSGIAVSPLLLESEVNMLPYMETCCLLGSGREDLVLVIEFKPQMQVARLELLKDVQAIIIKAKIELTVKSDNILILPADVKIPLSPKKTVLRAKLRRIIAEGVSKTDAPVKSSSGKLNSIKTAIKDGLLEMGLQFEEDESFYEIGQDIGPSLMFTQNTPSKLLEFLAKDEMMIPEPPVQKSVTLPTSKPSYSNEKASLAIIGAGCRYPMDINSPAEFWKFLVQGKSWITHPPKDRNSLSGVKTPGGFLSKAVVEEFDCKFFGLSPKDVKIMDPIHRVLLETTYNALEESQVSIASLRGSKTGVFVGVRPQGFQVHAHDVYDEAEYPRQYGAGTDMTFSANRISHFFGLKGPSVAISTACASGISVFDYAAKSLLAGDCDMAIVGAASVISHYSIAKGLESTGIMSAEFGRCGSFDDRADGYVPAEGCVVFVLRRVNASAKIPENCLGLVAGWSHMHNGGESMGITAPSMIRESEAMLEALHKAQLDPNDIDFVEAHATGTKIGDSIEARAIQTVFGAKRREQPLMVGAAKALLGHTESVAALTGMLKVLLCMKNSLICPTLLDMNHFHEGVQGPFQSIPAWVPNQIEIWPQSISTKHAMVFAAGLGGSLGAIILKSAPPTNSMESLSTNSTEPVANLVTLSASSLKSLNQLKLECVRKLKIAMNMPLPPSCTDIAAYHSRLPTYPFRFATIVSSISELIQNLSEFEETVEAIRRPKCTFVFPGQGAMDIKLFRGVYKISHVFRENVDACLMAFEKIGLLNYFQTFFSAEDSEDIPNKVDAQCLLFAGQYSLAQVYLSKNIIPTCVFGHSFGEIVAATIAGAFNLDLAARLVYYRSLHLSSDECDGSMVNAFATREEIEKALGPHLSSIDIAVINGTTSIVLSGTHEAIDRGVELLTASHITSRKVPVSVAFHSRLVKDAAEKLKSALESFYFAHPLKYDLVSCLDKREFPAGSTIPVEHWFEHIVSTVDFAGTVHLIDSKYSPNVILEMGDGNAKKIITRQISKSAKSKGTVLLEALSEERTVLNSLANLFKVGFSIDLGYEKQTMKSSYCLPLYQFDRQNSWLPKPLRARTELRQSTVTVSVKSNPFLQDHKLNDSKGSMILPGAALLSLAMSKILPSRTGALSTEFIAPILLDEGGDNVLEFNQTDNKSYEVYYKNMVRARATISEAQSTSSRPANSDWFNFEVQHKVDIDSWYSSADSDVFYGPSFRIVKELYAMPDGTVFALIETSPSLVAEKWEVSPTILDACLHMMAPVYGKKGLPRAILEFELYKDIPSKVWCVHKTLKSSDDEPTFESSFAVFDYETRECVCKSSNLVVQKTDRQLASSQKDQGVVSEFKRGLLWSPTWDVIQKSSLSMSSKVASSAWILVCNPENPIVSLLGSFTENIYVVSSVSDLDGPTTLGIPFDEWEEDEVDSLHVVIPTWDTVEALCVDHAGRWWSGCKLDTVIPLLQHLSKLKRKHSTIISSTCVYSVTRNLFSPIDKDAPTFASSAPLVGLLRNAVTELGMKAKILDFGEGDLGKLLVSNLFKLMDLEETFKVYSFRDGEWYTQNLGRKDVICSAPSEIGKSYLVFGGVGGVSLELAKHLSSRLHRVTIAGRSPSSDPRVISSLKSLDASLVEYIQADISESEQVSSLFAKLGNRKLDGVVHAAGILKDGLFGSVNETVIGDVGRPKVDGALVLIEALEKHYNNSNDTSKPTVVLLSSIASVLGSKGQTSYVVVNTTIDHLACQLSNTTNSKATALSPWYIKSLQLGLVKGIGMAANADKHHADVAEVSVSSEDVCAIIYQVLSTPAIFDSCTAISPLAVDGTVYVEEKVEDAKRVKDGNSLQFQPNASIPEIKSVPLDSKETVAQNGVAEDVDIPKKGNTVGEVLKELEAFVSMTLEYDADDTVIINEALVKLGVDSIHAIAIQQRVLKVYGVSIDLNDVFNMSLQEMSFYVFGSQQR
ncbi:hypothetical protein HDV05_005707 [Chytridiales sp. JEL 0842]|nr:hypothetical protein HDV05_005707 [Chytridiales sp. JEL 0842]